MYSEGQGTWLPFHLSDLQIHSILGFREFPKIKPTFIHQLIAIQYSYIKSHLESVFCSSNHSLNLSINLSINRIATTPKSPVKLGTVARQTNRNSTTKSMKQFRNMNVPSGVLVSMGKRPSQRCVLRRFLKAAT